MDVILALIIAAAVFFAAWKGQMMIMPKGAPITAPDQRQQNQQEENPWVYPGAKQIDKNTFQSSDSPDTITSWYQNLINEAGMTVTSFVVTNTNNNIVNKLVGATPEVTANIEISKMANETMTTIKINADATNKTPDATTPGEII